MDTSLSKTCEHCRREFRRSEGRANPEATTMFLKRRFCSHHCSSQHQRKSPLLIGTVVGRWTVLEEAPASPTQGPMYRCQCLCGNVTEVSDKSLRRGLNRKGRGGSTGCQACGRGIKHGLLRGVRSGGSTPTEYGMLIRARQRAKAQRLPFDLELADIVIPAVCPLLGIPIHPATGRFDGNSPALDRLIPEKGYVRGNVWVISSRANTIKSDATLEELESLVRGMRQRLGREAMIEAALDAQAVRDAGAVIVPQL